MNLKINNDRYMLIYLVIILIVLLIFIYINKYKIFDTFSNTNNDNNKIKNKIMNDLDIDNIRTELKDEFDNMKLEYIDIPLILTDSGELCKNWESGNICREIPQNKMFICINNKVGDNVTSNIDISDTSNTQITKNEIEYCNNWMLSSIEELRQINIDSILKDNLDTALDSMTDYIKMYDQILRIREECDMKMNNIKQNTLLANSQKYFLDNNKINISDKEYIKKNRDEMIDKYNNDMTSSYYLFKTNSKTNEKYKKYVKYMEYTIYILSALIIITLLFNILYTQI